MEKQYIFSPLQERPKDLGNQKVLNGFNGLTWKTIYIQPAAGEKKLENKKVLKVFNSLTRKTVYIQHAAGEKKISGKLKSVECF